MFRKPRQNRQTSTQVSRHNNKYTASSSLSSLLSFLSCCWIQGFDDPPAISRKEALDLYRCLTSLNSSLQSLAGVMQRAMQGEMGHGQKLVMKERLHRYQASHKKSASLHHHLSAACQIHPQPMCLDLGASWHVETWVFRLDVCMIPGSDITLHDLRQDAGRQFQAF